MIMIISIYVFSYSPYSFITMFHYMLFKTFNTIDIIMLMLYFGIIFETEFAPKFSVSVNYLQLFIFRQNLIYSPANVF